MKFIVNILIWFIPFSGSNIGSKKEYHSFSRSVWSSTRAKRRCETRNVKCQGKILFLRFCWIIILSQFICFFIYERIQNFFTNHLIHVLDLFLDPVRYDLRHSCGHIRHYVLSKTKGNISKTLVMMMLMTSKLND